MNKHYQYMEERNWDYSKLNYNEMYYYRAIHLLAISKRENNPDFFNFLTEHFKNLKGMGIKVDINLMKKEAIGLSEMEIPMMIAPNSGGFKFYEKVPKKNFDRFKFRLKKDKKDL